MPELISSKIIRRNKNIIENILKITMDSHSMGVKKSLAVASWREWLGLLRNEEGPAVLTIMIL